MSYKVIITSMLVVCMTSAALGQKPNVYEYVNKIETGQAESVRNELPSLIERFPSDPGVLYLQALLSVDGSEAVRMYQSIVDNFPTSEWADDALYKVYQFYYALGLYRTAQIKLDQLQGTYPMSRYLTQSAANPIGGLEDEQEQPLSPPPDTVSVTQGERFALQVGAYSTQVNAEKQKLFFENLDLPVEVINKVKDDRSLYIVLVGNFPTAELALSKGVEIKSAYNIESMVVTK